MEADVTEEKPKALLASAEGLRWQLDGDFHEGVVEVIYAEAARIADRAVIRTDKAAANLVWCAGCFIDCDS